MKTIISTKTTAAVNELKKQFAQNGTVWNTPKEGRVDMKNAESVFNMDSAPYLQCVWEGHQNARKLAAELIAGAAVSARNTAPMFYEDGENEDENEGAAERISMAICDVINAAAEELKQSTKTTKKAQNE